MAAALRNAGTRGADSASPADLLLAIARDPQSGGTWLLIHCGTPVDRIISDLESVPSVGLRRQKAAVLDDSLLSVLNAAEKYSRRLGHDHIGTEHAILAMCRARTHDALPNADDAEAALRQWISSGMPRGTGLPAHLPGPIMRLLQMTLMPWRMFVRKSLAHPKFTSDPYPLYRWLRQHEPVRKDPIAPVWILTRYDDVSAFLKDDRYLKDPFLTEHLPAEARRQLAVQIDPNRPEIDTISMLFLDPPEHTRVRSAFTRAFTPRNLADLRPRIEKITSERLDAVGNSQRCDLIATLAYPLPVMVIADMLGFPVSDYENIKRWSDELTASLALTASSLDQARARMARDEMQVYFDGIVSDLQKNPRDTSLGRLVAQMEQPGGMNRDEIFANSILLLAAGHETTTNLIGNGLLALLRNRDQWELLVQKPALAESAVEEMLRYDCPVQWTSRMAGQEIEVGGTKIPEGAIVLGCVGAANRDPARFTEPDRFDIQRPDNRHLSFGTGIHFCLGAALARMEAQVALTALVQRFPKMRLASQRIRWMRGLTFRGVLELWVERS